ncbi:hypothetical protein B0T17DRAFT_654708 [Bombardia bombarda]|uniref:BTB domain-containing protein n=1 Tax=Bombardia bombarda TaxID=252184 RepID=A0AA39X065_9PEZI|nr:hypothetical protein B0T17DRAFT_654708 [Bombardia bombarda]
MAEICEPGELPFNPLKDEIGDEEYNYPPPAPEQRSSPPGSPFTRAQSTPTVRQTPFVKSPDEHDSGSATALALAPIPIPVPSQRTVPLTVAANSATAGSVETDLLEVLDPAGDLVLIVGTEGKKFLVCSRTMARHSDFFVRFNREYEASPHTDGRKPRCIRLARQKVEAMRVVLLKVHGKLAQVYTYVSSTNLQLLHDVIVATHHFDMTECLAGISVKWLKLVYKPQPSRYDEIATQLWITFRLGHLGCVKQTIQAMVTYGRLNSEGELIGRGAKDSQPYCKFPTMEALGILDDIKKCRDDMITKLVTIVSDAHDGLMNSPIIVSAICSGESVCRAKQSQTRCDCTMGGALGRALRQLDWKNEDLSASPHRLYTHIEAIRAKALEQTGSTQAHQHCEPFGGKLPSLQQLAHDMVETMSFDVDKFTRRARALGFSNPRYQAERPGADGEM